MAFLPTVLNGGGAGETFLADSSSFTTASVTFTPGALGLVVVESSKGGSPDTPTVSGWTLVAATTNGAGRNVAVFRNNSPSNGTITADFAGVTQTGAVIAVLEVATGWNTTSPITQSKTASGSGTSATASLDAAPAAGALVVSALGLQLNTDVTADGQYTEIVDLGHGSPVQRLHVAYDASTPGASATHTFSSTSWGLILVEVAAAAAGVTLTIAEAAHAHAGDSVALTQVHILAVSEGSHGHVADNLALTQVHGLAVVDAAHAHTADSVTLPVTADLTIADATLGHMADNLTLAGEGDLSPADAAHAHTADDLALTQHHQLAAADSSHAHTADPLAVTQVHVLTVGDASHDHISDSPSLGQTHVLLVAEGAHGHLADIVVLEIGGIVSAAAWWRLEAGLVTSGRDDGALVTSSRSDASLGAAGRRDGG